MERISDRGVLSMEINGGVHGRLSPPRHPPNYSNGIVQDALEHLASIDLIELCNEAKIERCRATRDLSSCGRFVQHVLNSCGHASLCAECSQRCDICPICRTSIPNSGSKIRLRLYYKCIESGLISKRHDDRFQEKDDSGEYLLADIQRLYSLFDVALENNLVSLICHYVTDVCMDENAVSSDPILAFLLDEVVVKDWCKRTFKNIIYDLRGIYSDGVEAMRSKLCLFQKLSQQLTGISNVLEVMDSSFEGTFSAQLRDLHHLLENVLKAKQHLDVMTWCARHQFLEDIQSRYPNFASWTFHLHERKLAALTRTWPDISSNLTEPAGPHNSLLFIEQALSNLGIEQTYMEKKEEVDISCLQDRDSPLMFRSTIDVADKSVAAGCYPFETLRAATDILFLHGTSDMMVAKQAIFLYYLFDRHWTRPDLEWRHLVDDFAASFGLSRDLLLESLSFYLLDDHTDQALKEASHLLPEIAGPETHQRIAQVLLERQCPDVALTVLRCSGRDGFCAYANTEHEGLQCVSLGEAVTAVRVRIECGLLTEAFIYHRMHCSKVKEEKSKHGSSATVSDKLNSDSWVHQVEVLVIEICYLCIRRNLVDRMIELPWDSDEEKYLHKCLFEHACQDPSTVCGSLLMVFYLQRYRYAEAYYVDRKLQNLEQNFSETANVEVISRIRSISQWRAKLVDKCLKLLPEVQRVQVVAGDMAENDHAAVQDVQMPPEFECSNVPPNPSTILTPSSVKPSLLLHTNLSPHASKKPLPDSAANFSSSIGNGHLRSGKKAPSILQRRLLSLGTPTTTRMNSAVDGVSSSTPHDGDNSPLANSIFRDVRADDGDGQGVQPVGFPFTLNHHFGSSAHLKEWNRGASRVPLNDKQFQVGKNAYGTESYDFLGHAENSHPPMPRFTSEDDGDLMDTSHGNGFLSESIHDQNPSISRKQSLVDRPWNKVFSEDANMNSWSFGKSNSPIEDANLKGGSRWRSDESSEDEADRGLDRYMHSGASVVTRRRARFSRR